MSKWKAFLQISMGYKLMYMGAIFAIVFAALFHFSNPLIIRFTIDNIIAGEMPENKYLLRIFELFGGREFFLERIFLLSLLLLCIAIIEGVFQFAKGKWAAVASEGIAKKIREKMYEHIQNLPYADHIKAETGDWIQRCISDVETVRRFFAAQLIEVGRASLMLLLVLPLMIKLSPKMTFYAMLAVPVIFLSAFIFFIKIKHAFQESDEAEARLSTVLQENITGIRVVRAFARENYEIEKFDEVNRDFRDKGEYLITLLAYYWSISDLICFLQIAGVIVAGTVFASRGEITVGTIVVFLSYETAVLFPIRQMGRVLTDMGKASVSWGRIYEILSKKTEKDLPQGIKPKIKGRIEFQNLSMSYENDQKVLKNLNLSIEAGQTVAFMGPSGSGKSSIIKALLRFYDYEGSIKIDDVELSEIDRYWIRENIGTVLQEPFLYSKTVLENIKISCPESDIEMVENSAKIAGVHNVLKSFEKGYNTLLGEKGVNLSGGQKQRVAIARAIIRNTPVLIFDDSLSAVDTETESYILKQLKKLSGKVTVIIIAHRLSSVMNADKIFVLNHGELLQSGSHEELINQSGMYQRIWNLQSELEDSLNLELQQAQIKSTDADEKTEIDIFKGA